MGPIDFDTVLIIRDGRAAVWIQERKRMMHGSVFDTRHIMAKEIFWYLYYEWKQ